MNIRYYISKQGVLQLLKRQKVITVILTIKCGFSTIITEDKKMTSKQRITLLFALSFSPLIMLSQSKPEHNDIKKDKNNFLFEKLGEGTNTEAKFKKDYKQGCEFYNKAVEMITKMDNEVTLIQMDSIEKTTKEQFKLALPYFENAHALFPTDKNTLEALMGCYFGLKDNEKYIKYKKELDLLGKK